MFCSTRSQCMHLHRSGRTTVPLLLQTLGQEVWHWLSITSPYIISVLMFYNSQPSSRSRPLQVSFQG